jgi:hypothetical protein
MPEFNKSASYNAFTTSTGTGANTTETALATFSLPLQALNANGKGFRFRAWGTTAANGNNKTMKAYLGSTVLASTGTIALNDGKWVLDCEVIRTGAAAQVIRGRASHKDGSLEADNYTVATGTEDETTALTVTMKGTNGTAAANDIVLKGAVLEVMV